MGLAFVIARLLWPLIPNGRFKDTIYDRTWRHRHKVAFTVLLVVGVYGTVIGMVYVYS